MARNQDRQFSESDSLKALDLGSSPAEPEKRQPLWERPRADENREDQPGRGGSMPISAGREEDITFDVPSRQGRQEKTVFPEKAEEREETISQPHIKKIQEGPWEEPKPAEARPRKFQAEAAAAPIGEEPPEEPENAENPEEEGDGELQQKLPPKAIKRAPRPQKNGEDGGKKAPKGRKDRKKKKKKNQDEDDRRGFIRTMLIAGICTILFVMVALMVLSNFISHPLLALPRKMVTAVVTPVQNFFSNVTDSVAGYLRTLKIRGNLEYEYEQLLIQLDDYATQVAQNEELRRINESLYDLLDEQNSHREMDPVAATVIGTDSGNYFSTLTLNVGSANGVKEYMAVVSKGGLVGVTYNVEEHKCQVRCIINSDATVAGLIQSSRDQGSVKGTLGTNGEPMCRMYYLPENSMPRPGDMVVTSGVGMEFPKGIPIGYIRESTRGMEDNKSYVVVEPVVDFQHLEYVTVYRYTPAYAEAAQHHETGAALELKPLSTVRPVPPFKEGINDDFLTGPAGTPDPLAATATPLPDTTPAAGQTPAPTATPNPNETPLPPNLEYKPRPDPSQTEAPTPRPTFTPAPTPAPTLDPGGMTVEDE